MVGGTSQSLGSAAPDQITASPTTTGPPNFVLPVGSSSITANSNSQFVIDGQTLTRGGVVTVSGSKSSRRSFHPLQCSSSSFEGHGLGLRVTQEESC